MFFEAAERSFEAHAEQTRHVVATSENAQLLLLVDGEISECFGAKLVIWQKFSCLKLRIVFEVHAARVVEDDVRVDGHNHLGSADSVQVSDLEIRFIW